MLAEGGARLARHLLDLSRAGGALRGRDLHGLVEDALRDQLVAVGKVVEGRVERVLDGGGGAGGLVVVAREDSEEGVSALGPVVAPLDVGVLAQPIEAGADRQAEAAGEVIGHGILSFRGSSHTGLSGVLLPSF